MNGVEPVNPPLDREVVDAAAESKRERRPERKKPVAVIDDSSPDPMSATDRYRLSMPYTETL